MTKFKDKIKSLLKIILYFTIIFSIPIVITALYILYNEGTNSFQRGVSAFLLITVYTLLLLTICSQLKYGLIFSSNMLKFPENLVKNNILKNILKIVLKIILYSFLIFLNALIIILLIDFSDKELEIFPLETTQFLIIMSFITISFMLYKDFKKLYNFSSKKIKFLEGLPQKIIEKSKMMKEKILTINFNFFKNILEKSKKILNFISNKLERLVDLLEVKINYPEKCDFKERYNFPNTRNKLEKFIKISYLILIYLTIFSICCILIPVVLIITYQFLIYLITLLTTIWEVLVAIITSL